MVPSHHVGIFLPKTKVFFSAWLHPDIASVVGESVIGQGIGKIDIPIMLHLAKARRWSKRWQACLSSPDLQASQPVMARRSKYVDATYYVKILQNPR